MRRTALKLARRIGFAWLLLVLAPRAFAANPCDSGLAVDDLDPLQGAAAFELCDVSTQGSPGVVSATYGASDFAVDFTQLSNSAIGVGLLADFGPNVTPLRGARMLALSSGTARTPSQPGYASPEGFNKGYSSGFPAGLPIESPACPAVTTAAPHDAAALRLVLQVPATANSFSFGFKFYTADFPNFLCSPFNDLFFAVLDPAPATGPNLVFDPSGNALTVNSATAISVCDPQAAPNGYVCGDGSADLQGTGFDSPTIHGATSWLHTIVPVTPSSSVTLTFGILDAGDGALDSTVLLDDFRWSARVVASPVTSAPEPSTTAVAAAAIAALAARRRVAQMR